MSPSLLVVLLAGEPIGEIEQDRKGRLEFRYSDAHVSQADPLPLSMSMRPQIQSHPHGVIAPWLWGVLPEDELVRRRWAEDFNVPDDSPFALLSTPVGHDCPGSVQFCVPDEVDALLSTPSEIEWLSEEDLAARLRDLSDNPAAWLASDRPHHFSLAGGQPKTALHYAEGRWGIPTGKVPTTHILKPALPDFWASDLNEHLCMTTARLLGLPAAETTMLRAEDQVAVAVRRFDRRSVGGTMQRLHQEDLCQALGLLPTQKYERWGGPSAAQIAECLRANAYPDTAETQVGEFVDALAYNWTIGGNDAHAKNYSLLLSTSGARLAPLYDVISRAPYERRPMHPRIQLAMRVGGKLRAERIGGADWMATADALHVDRDETIERVAYIADNVCDALSQAAEDIDIQRHHRALAGRLTNGIRASALRAAEQLRSGIDNPPERPPHPGL